MLLKSYVNIILFRFDINIYIDNRLQSVKTAATYTFINNIIQLRL